jgi:hypothetical protein
VIPVVFDMHHLAAHERCHLDVTPGARLPSTVAKGVVSGLAADGSGVRHAGACGEGTRNRHADVTPPAENAHANALGENSATRALSVESSTCVMPLNLGPECALQPSGLASCPAQDVPINAQQET